MNKIYIIVLVAIIYPCICFPGAPDTIKITNLDSIKSFTNAEEDWDPESFDRSVFEQEVENYLDINENDDFLDYAGNNTKALCDYIRENLSQYRIEYAGIVIEGRKLTYVSMLSGTDDRGNDDAFTFVLDEGCSFVIVTYDPVNNKVTSLICNGVA
jgi:hypothetical protein